MGARWVPQPDAPAVEHRPYLNRVLDDVFCIGDGEFWPCLHYRQNPAARCHCSHLERQHGTDRRGRAMCFGSQVCACNQFEEKGPA